jgi:hypothetical protein
MSEPEYPHANDQRFAVRADVRADDSGEMAYCPANAAGFVGNSGQTESWVKAAEWYDEKVAEMFGGEGPRTIPREKAEIAWLQTIEDLRDSDHHSAAATAERIADRLSFGEEDSD